MRRERLNGNVPDQQLRVKRVECLYPNGRTDERSEGAKERYAYTNAIDSLLLLYCTVLYYDSIQYDAASSFFTVYFCPIFRCRQALQRSLTVSCRVNSPSFYDFVMAVEKK